jgi:hypothetical protein
VVKRKLFLGIGALGLLGVTGFVAFRAYRGPTGEIAAAGDATSTVVPEFPSLDPALWRNGQPQSMVASRGEVVFLEGWSPS